ncbi:helix-turn-helix domain-containing protein [Luethyella okanaganae]|uniref:Helix-turn-helix domain-containing protein n=1 Tax=Luethyella okanaganae TaxID=69372 RepID=A0ABW1VAP1_9MICO
MAVVEEIDNARKHSGMTHAKLFKLSGMSQNYYYSRMRGDLPFNTNDIDKIAQAIEANPFEIMHAASKRFDAGQAK